MNKLILTTLVAVLFISASLQAQIKDQFQDSSNSSTTVVVKEDNASDMDILNSQFDLDDVGMHQVIRITTRKEVEPAPAPEKVIVEQPTVVKETALASIDATPKAPEESLAINTERTTTEEKVEKEDLNSIPAAAPVTKTVSQKTTRSSSSSKSYKRKKSKSQKFKIFNKRFKRQKRKRVPRKKRRDNRCYRF